MKIMRDMIAAGLLTAMAGAAGAATVSVTLAPVSGYAALTSTWNAVSQDFEAVGASGSGKQREVALVSTNVGTFRTLGGKGTGDTIKDKLGNVTPKNTGTKIALRNRPVYGRENVLPLGGKWYLDSNDTFGIGWSVALAGGKQFDKLIFALTDPADQGAFLRILVDGVVKQTLSKLPNGTSKLVMVDFGEAIKSASVELWNFSKATGGKPMVNDGFGIDGIEVAQVPLPATLLLLGGGLGGLGALRRRRAV